MNFDKNTSDIINQFKLSIHPEGGWYREIFRGEDYVTRKDCQKRTNITSIYYLLCKGENSSWHRVNNADEIWIFLQGSPLNLRCLDEDNKKIKNLNLHTNNPIEIIPAGYWQCASTSGEFTLTSCCVGPGFDFLDFEMLRDLDPSLRPSKAIKDFI